MPRKTGALKAARRNLRRRLRNQSLRTAYRTAVKRVHAALEMKDLEAAREHLKRAIPLIARTASKGVIHKNTASRLIARLSQRADALKPPQVGSRP